jgi:hypothetical protein
VNDEIVEECDMGNVVIDNWKGKGRDSANMKEKVVDPEELI